MSLTPLHKEPARESSASIDPKKEWQSMKADTPSLTGIHARIFLLHTLINAYRVLRTNHRGAHRCNFVIELLRENHYMLLVCLI